MAAGARGYLVKGAPQERIIDAVRAVARGSSYSAPTSPPRSSPSSPRARRGATQPSPSSLEREGELLKRIALGHNNRRIAHDLVLSEKTVRNHVSNIFAELRVADRAEAIVRAPEAGLGSDGAPERRL